jgi:hypothetical protein
MDFSSTDVTIVPFSAKVLYFLTVYPAQFWITNEDPNLETKGIIMCCVVRAVTHLTEQ